MISDDKKKLEELDRDIKAFGGLVWFWAGGLLGMGIAIFFHLFEAIPWSIANDFSKPMHEAPWGTWGFVGLVIGGLVWFLGMAFCFGT